MARALICMAVFFAVPIAGALILPQLTDASLSLLAAYGYTLGLGGGLVSIFLLPPPVELSFANLIGKAVYLTESIVRWGGTVVKIVFFSAAMASAPATLVWMELQERKPADESHAHVPVSGPVQERKHSEPEVSLNAREEPMESSRPEGAAAPIDGSPLPTESSTNDVGELRKSDELLSEATHLSAAKSALDRLVQMNDPSDSGPRTAVCTGSFTVIAQERILKAPRAEVVCRNSGPAVSVNWPTKLVLHAGGGRIKFLVPTGQKGYIHLLEIHGDFLFMVDKDEAWYQDGVLTKFEVPKSPPQDRSNGPLRRRVRELEFGQETGRIGDLYWGPGFRPLEFHVQLRREAPSYVPKLDSCFQFERLVGHRLSQLSRHRPKQPAGVAWKREMEAVETEKGVFSRLNSRGRSEGPRTDLQRLRREEARRSNAKPLVYTDSLKGIFGHVDPAENAAVSPRLKSEVETISFSKPSVPVLWEPPTVLITRVRQDSTNFSMSVYSRPSGREKALKMAEFGCKILDRE